MTDPAAPVTEAGRALLDDVAPYARQNAPEKDTKANLGRRVKLQRHILAIEAEAAQAAEPEAFRRGWTAGHETARVEVQRDLSAAEQRVTELREALDDCLRELELIPDEARAGDQNDAIVAARQALANTDAAAATDGSVESRRMDAAAAEQRIIAEWRRLQLALKEHEDWYAPTRMNVSGWVNCDSEGRFHGGIYIDGDPLTRDEWGEEPLVEDGESPEQVIEGLVAAMAQYRADRERERAEWAAEAAALQSEAEKPEGQER